MYVRPEMKVMAMRLSNSVLDLSTISSEGATDVYAPHSLF